MNRFNFSTEIRLYCRTLEENRAAGSGKHLRTYGYSLNIDMDLDLNR